MRKIVVASVLSLSILASSTGAQFASAQENGAFIQEIKDEKLGITAQIQKDDENVKKVKVTAENGTSIVEYDKKRDILRVEENGETYEINLAEERPKVERKMAALQAKVDLGDYDVVDDYEDYWWDAYVISYDYYEINEMLWNLSDGEDTKTTWEASANSSRLEKFSGQLQNLRSKQRAAEAAVATGVASVVAGVAAAPVTAGVSTVVGIALSLGAAVYAASLFGDAQDIRKDIHSNFRRIEVIAFDEL